MTEGQKENDSPDQVKMPSSSSNGPRMSKDVKIKSGQLFGPFQDPLQWLASKCANSPSELYGNNFCNKTTDYFQFIDVAQHPKEQNTEIILENGLFYFRIMSNLSEKTSSNEEASQSSCSNLLAWFSEDLSSRLPIPYSTIVNGQKRYVCGLCNQTFTHPNPVVVHILFECSKRHDLVLIRSMAANMAVNCLKSDNQLLSGAYNRSPSNFSKKRGFDIDSLVNDSQDESPSLLESSNKKTRLDGETLFKSGPVLSPVSSDCTRNINTSAPMETQHAMSAFRKVDKTRQNLSHSSASSFHPSSLSAASLLSSYGSASSFPDFASLSSLYSMSRTLNCDQTLASTTSPTASPPASSLSSSAMFSPQTPSLVHKGLAGALLSQPPSSVIPPGMGGSTLSVGQAPGNGSKSMIPATLLPFLPPSLAALSFPQTNWCAKCNATFRMTSDLVYHMRSHHKKEANLDPLKKKREDKLRCNICGETFRERHHLTRHMTSHQ